MDPYRLVQIIRVRGIDVLTKFEGATENAGLENAGLENAAPDCRGGKRGSSTVWKAEVSVI